MREWNSVDNALDRLSLCKSVTLVLRPQFWVMDDKFHELIEKHFPLMWENGRVVLEGRLPYLKDEPIERTRIGPEQIL